LSRTPLHIACVKGNTEIVEVLLNDKRVKTNDEGTAFYLACEDGRIKIVKSLLSNAREVNVNAKDEEGRTAIDVARSLHQQPLWKY